MLKTVRSLVGVRMFKRMKDSKKRTLQNTRALFALRKADNLGYVPGTVTRIRYVTAEDVKLKAEAVTSNVDEVVH